MRIRIMLLSLLSTFLLSCGQQDSAGVTATATATGSSRPVVVCSNYPLYSFTREIAGDAVDVRFPDIEGDPAQWAPRGEDVRIMQQADLLIINGAGYESWLAFTTLPAGLLLDTTAPFSDQLLPIEGGTVHQHGPEGEHSHQDTAFTTWLDPGLATRQAQVIEQGLSGLLPGQGARFKANLAKLEGRLSELDGKLAKAFSGLDGQAVVFSHPVYQYLQNRYGVNGRSVHWEPDVEPGTREWIDFSNLLRKHPASLLIWEAEPAVATRAQLEELGIESVVFAPVGNRPESGDYFSVMKQNAAKLETALNPR